MLDLSLYENRVRCSLNMARAEFDVGEIAKRIDVRQNYLGSFLKGGKISEKYLPAAERFVRDAGYWIWDHDAGRIEKGLRAVALDLRGLADFIESPAFDIDIKTERLTQSIGMYQATLDTIKASVENCEKV